jgi:hypothetical protein
MGLTSCPIDHDRRNANRPATRCAIGIATVAVSLSNASPDRHTLNGAEATSTAGKLPLMPLSARDLIAVQQLLGHAEPETTAVYARVPDGALLTAVRATSGWRP